ncbi:hypothetical protein JW897_06500 [Chromobacterium alkanivorans]|uniref:hypothetical protein n=1 Tax=Chromobacterium alkanivorans TaxID=1071719 RepID=UPI001967F975|nr:hypothetical protein [Chromobacterium alkanivorans]MBN3003386.1 hypothetical protein [Chromobacterium alkanivorans]
MNPHETGAVNAPSINLQPFCASQNDFRDWMRTPFRMNGKSYASNGHILIETEGGDHPDIPAIMIQRITDILASLPTAGYQALPVIPAPKFRPCRTCTGRGDKPTCPACVGHGKFKHYDDWYDCKPCDGKGHFNDPCQDCNATGQIDTSRPVRVGIARFQRNYLSLIAQLPTPLLATGSMPDDIAGFTFHGGRGALMPLKS